MDPLLVCLEVAAFLGVVTSLAMLCSNSGRPYRLLKRQLWHQAMATLLFTGSKAVLTIISVFTSDVIDCQGEPEDSPYTNVVRQVQHGTFFLSCLVEVHIAASMVAAAYHRRRTLEFLSFWLPIIWPLWFAYTCFTVYEANTFVDNISSEDLFGFYVDMSLFSITFILYLIALYASTRSNSPGVVVRRMRLRVMVYPTMFMITGFPSCLRYVGLFEWCSTAGKVSMILENAEATFNYLAFWILNCREPLALFGTHLVVLPTAEARNTRVVGFDPHFSQSEAVPNGSWRNEGQWIERNNSLDLEVVHARGRGHADSVHSEYEEYED